MNPFVQSLKKAFFWVCLLLNNYIVICEHFLLSTTFMQRCRKQYTHKCSEVRWTYILLFPKWRHNLSKGNSYLKRCSISKKQKKNSGKTHTNTHTNTPKIEEPASAFLLLLVPFGTTKQTTTIVSDGCFFCPSWRRRRLWGSPNRRFLNVRESDRWKIAMAGRLEVAVVAWKVPEKKDICSGT